MPIEADEEVDSHLEDFFAQLDTARELWSKFAGQKSKIEAGFLSAVKSARANRNERAMASGTTFFAGCDLGIYADLDTAIDDAGQMLERYMLAVHEMKAAFEKALEIAKQGADLSPLAGSALGGYEMVQDVFSQAMAAQAAWDKSFNAVMPLYRRFKLASAEKR